MKGKYLNTDKIFMLLRFSGRTNMKYNHNV